MSFSLRKKKPREVHFWDLAVHFFLKFLACLVIALLVMIVFALYQAAAPAFHAFGGKFFFSNVWDPVQLHFGAAAFVYGTVVSSLIALAIAVPVSIGTALFLTELSPQFLRGPIGFLVEMLAAIPSVVYGLWGIFVLAPAIRTYIEPVLAKYLGFLPLFQGAPFGIGMMSAGIILAIMITPTITAICREVFRSIPTLLREGALALGATRWEMIILGVIKPGLSGIFGAIILGLGRAIGETMAVTMLIGNKPSISLSLFEPASTMASVIANEYAEANDALHLSSLAAIGLALFFVSLLVNSISRFIIWRVSRVE